jgi:threonine dehydrogenase-like Zn-dependent dehydrogenase
MQRTTKAAFLRGPERIEIKERTLPALEPGQVLLADLICGICGTDVAKWRGEERYTGWLGHEFGGIVAAVGEGVDNVEVGEPVAAWIRPGWPFGGLAEWTIVQAEHCVPMPRELTWAAEPLMCVINAVITTRPCLGPLGFGDYHPLRSFGYAPELRRHIVVVGTGMMALLATALSALEQPHSLIVIGRTQAALDRAVRLGATHTILAADTTALDIKRQVERITPRVDVVYEGVGDKTALQRAVTLARMGGSASILGYHQSENGFRTVRMGEVMGERAVHLLSGHTRDAGTAGLAPKEDLVMPAMRMGAHLIKAGTLDLAALREPSAWSLERVSDALAKAAESGHGKVIVDSTL